MMANDLEGLLVVPLFIGGSPAKLAFSKEAAAGIRVIVNLRYSWSTDQGGMGTLPEPSSERETEFVQAAIATIREGRGVWGWEIGNEANNPREWPAGARLTAEDVARVYAKIWNAVEVSDRLSPGALDPYNAQAGDPRDWLRVIWQRIELIAGAEFVAAHGYVRGPDAALVGSTARFTDAPLLWQYLNYPGCVTALLDALPTAYRYHPVYVTEFNHLFVDVEPNWGWVRDSRAGEVISAAYAVAKAFAGVALYRWDGDAWAIRGNAAALDEVKGIGRV